LYNKIVKLLHAVDKILISFCCSLNDIPW